MVYVRADGRKFGEIGECGMVDWMKGDIKSYGIILEDNIQPQISGIFFPLFHIVPI